MDRSDVISLVSYSLSQDAYGVWQKTKTARDVFCAVDSVTRDEFFEGGRNGFNPQFRMTMFAPDYQGEEEVEYNGVSYGVYRTYRANTDLLELYVEKKGGVNKSEEDTAGPAPDGH